MRADGDEATVATVLKQFEKNSGPVLAAYEAAGILHTVDTGAGRPEQESWLEAEQAVIAWLEAGPAGALGGGVALELPNSPSLRREGALAPSRRSA